MNAVAKSWRDLIKVHHAAAQFPMMSDDELDALAKDIAENGLQQPLVLWTPESLGRTGRDGPKEVYLLDGRNRLEAIERAIAKNAARCAEEIEAALYTGGSTGGARLLYGDIEPFAYVVSANLHRRHLTRDQKRDLVEKLLKANPERSDNATAKMAKVSDKTVGAARRGLEGRSEIPNVSTRTDAVGRQQPAAKPSKSPKPPSKEDQLRALREQQAERDIATASITTDRHGVADELEQVLRMLRGDRSRISQFPLGKRVALARGCLNLLNVTLDDLRPIGEAS